MKPKAEGTRMEAGRELDAQIAEKVMGWTGVECDPISTYGWSPEPELAWNQFQGTGDGRYHIPRYSTDIGAAWEVVEKMQAEGFDFSLDFHAGSGSWGALFCKGSGVVWPRHAAPCLAICLAALEAMKGSHL